MEYKVINDSRYLIHYNKNHSKANGQFTSGDGDGDSIIDDHHNYKKNIVKGAFKEAVKEAWDDGEIGPVHEGRRFIIGAKNRIMRKTGVSLHNSTSFISSLFLKSVTK